MNVVYTLDFVPQQVNKETESVRVQYLLFKHSIEGLSDITSFEYRYLDICHSILNLESK